MMSALMNTRALLLAIFILMAGSGFLSTLIAIRLEAAGVTAVTIGLVATSYFAGLTIGSIRVTRLLSEIGHIRSFAVFVSLYSATSLTYAIFENAAVWMVLRFVDGFVMAGVFICLESWLNRQATPVNRSSILAAYMIALYSGQAAGQYLLNLSHMSPDLPFMVSAILLSIALLPVLLTRMEQPMLEKVAPFSVGKLYAASPLGIIGTLSTGAMLGGFYALGAVYIQRLGLGVSEVALFTSSVIAGGVALQYPLGMLSDRFDRRSIIVACLFLIAAICAGFVMLDLTMGGLVVMAALFGGFSFALYPMCIAHSNDHLDEDQRVGASSGLVLTYSVGAMIGPILASSGMAAMGPAGLFIVIGVQAVAGGLFGLWRMAWAPPVPAEEQQTFQSLPRTTPMAAVLEAQDD